MKPFTGFPARSNYTPIPNMFFSSLLSQITDINELKVTLHIFAMVYPKKGLPKFVTRSELLNNIALMQSINKNTSERLDILDKALETAVNRGTLLSIEVNNESQADILYLINTEESRRAVARIRSGEILLSGMELKARQVEPPVSEPDVFTLYEENIGILTPLIADQLKDAEQQYPADWIREAFKEAVTLNKRNWRYISRILERWSSEGKSDGTNRRYTKENTDPDKYIRGKYGHIVQR